MAASPKARPVPRALTEEDAFSLWDAIGDKITEDQIHYDVFANAFVEVFSGDSTLFRDWPKHPVGLLFVVLDHFLAATIRKPHYEASQKEVATFSPFEEASSVTKVDVIVFAQRFGPKWRHTVTNITKHFLDGGGKIYPFLHGEICSYEAFSKLARNQYLVRLIPHADHTFEGGRPTFELILRDSDNHLHVLPFATQFDSADAPFRADRWVHHTAAAADNAKLEADRPSGSGFKSLSELLEGVARARSLTPLAAQWATLVNATVLTEAMSNAEILSYAAWTERRAKLWVAEQPYVTGAWLEKQSPAGVRPWQAGFYLKPDLASSCFRYFRPPTKSLVDIEKYEEGVVPFGRIVSVGRELTDVFEFQVMGMLSRTFKWRASSTPERDAWSRTVAHVMPKIANQFDTLRPDIEPMKWWKAAEQKQYLATLAFDQRADAAVGKGDHGLRGDAAVVGEGKEALSEDEIEKLMSGVATATGGREESDAAVKRRLAQSVTKLQFFVVNDTPYIVFCGLYLKSPPGFLGKVMRLGDQEIKIMPKKKSEGDTVYWEVTPVSLDFPKELASFASDFEFICSTVSTDHTNEMSMSTYFKLSHTTVSNNEPVYVLEPTAPAALRYYKAKGESSTPTLMIQSPVQSPRVTQKQESMRLLVLNGAQNTIAVAGGTDSSLDLSKLRVEMAEMRLQLRITDRNLDPAAYDAAVAALAQKTLLCQQKALEQMSTEGGRVKSLLDVTNVYANYRLHQSPASGFGVSPYSVMQSARYLINGITAGALSERNKIVVPAPSERPLQWTQVDVSANVDVLLNEVERIQAARYQEQAAAEAAASGGSAGSAGGGAGGVGIAVSADAGVVLPFGTAVVLRRFDPNDPQWSQLPRAATDPAHVGPLAETRHLHVLHRIEASYSGLYGCDRCTPPTSGPDASGLAFHCDVCFYDLCPPCALAILTQRRETPQQKAEREQIENHAVTERDRRGARERLARALAEKEAEAMATLAAQSWTPPKPAQKDAALDEVRAALNTPATTAAASATAAAKPDLGGARAKSATAANAAVGAAPAATSVLSPKAAAAPATPAPVQAATATVATGNAAQPLVRVLCLGDQMLMDLKKPFQVSPMLRYEMSTADIVIINCESIVAYMYELASQEEASEIREQPWKSKFKVSLEFVVNSLKAMGLDPRRTLYSLANNHAGDFGVEGLLVCKNLLESVGCTVIGVALDLTVGVRGMITKVRVNGLTVGVLAWTRWMNGTGWLPSLGSNERLPVFREEDVQYLIGEVEDGMPTVLSKVRRDQNIDYLIGFVHWEFEQSFLPTLYTSKWARRLLQPGRFDTVVGHGPHVLQPVEVFDEVAGAMANTLQAKHMVNTKGLLAYSIGNVCSMRGRWHTKMGGALFLNLDPNQRGAKIEATLYRNLLSSYKFVPYVQCEKVGATPSDRSMTLTRLRDMDDDEGDQYQRRFQEIFEEQFGVMLNYGKLAEWWCVRVWTANKLGAGTDDPVFLKGESTSGAFTPQWLLATTLDSEADFERGSVDTFFVGTRQPVTDVMRIQLSLVSTQRKLMIKQPQLKSKKEIVNLAEQLDAGFRADVDGWEVERVVMINLMNGQEFHFDIGKAITRVPLVVEVRKVANPVINPSVKLYLDQWTTFKTGDLILYERVGEDKSIWAKLAKLGSSAPKSKYSAIGILVVRDLKAFIPVDYVDGRQPASNDGAALAQFAELGTSAAAAPSDFKKQPVERKKIETLPRKYCRQHVHGLKLTSLAYGIPGVAFAFACNVCNKPMQGAAYQCLSCNWDMCFACADLHTAPQPIVGCTRAQSPLHQHDMLLSTPYASMIGGAWPCCLCLNIFTNPVASWHCVKCRVDLCTNCMELDEATFPRTPGGGAQVLLFEATNNKGDAPDITSGWRTYPGIHGTLLRQKVAVHTLGGGKTKMIHVPLKARLSQEQEDAMTRWLTRKHYMRVPYEAHRVGEALLKIGLTRLGLTSDDAKEEDDFSKIFAAELVAGALMQAAALPKGAKAQDYMTDMIASCPIYDLERATTF